MSDWPRGARLARSLALAGVAASALLFALLLTAGLPALDAALLAALLGLVPFLALAQLPMLGEVPLERMPVYWSSVVTLGLLGTACWLVGAREDGPAALGLVALPASQLVAWSVGLTATGLALILVFRRIASVVGVEDAAPLRELLPRTAPERGVFALLSVSAGVGEELAYRGYAIGAISPLLGPGGAAVLTSAVFGVVHGYQGPLGIVRTALMGGALAWGFLASGSLWPAIAAHALIDVLAGIVLGERLLSPRRTSGVEQAPRAP